MGNTTEGTFKFGDVVEVLEGAYDDGVTGKRAVVIKSAGVNATNEPDYLIAIMFEDRDIFDGAIGHVVADDIKHVN